MYCCYHSVIGRISIIIVFSGARNVILLLTAVVRIKIENGNRECVKETTTRPKSRQQLVATNWSSMQRETLTPGGVFYLAPNKNVY